MAFLATLLNVVENLALLGLTYFTSVDSYGEKGRGFVFCPTAIEIEIKVNNIVCLL